MKKISKIAGFIVLSVGFLNHSYANTATVSALEQQIYKKYTGQDFYTVNQQFESDVVKLIEKNADSYTYRFPKLTNGLGLNIHYAPNQLFKTYTFDVGGGGTMGTYSSYAQFKNAPKKKLQAIEAGFIRSVDQVTMSGQPVYLIQSYYKGDSCVGAYQIKAYKQQKNQLNPVQIFQTKSKKLDTIRVDYNCQYDADRKGDYIRTSKDLKFIDIKLLDQNTKPTGKYLRYQKNNNNYQYVGTVK
ncbi:hypothetical protein B9T25_07785 [Acinetobacter sp. ANC 4470]|uniref:hypothetical protein n=1 Tax=Acinetobacter sp. ANC 4470 TaxID=1977881 RepID=UPI000A357C09|nr:hypothetical protein [Acinetobacter sp. ANC 4470]OTG67871.1 hypothetical protein B9T25_07785 [Acinetobacter sp. ANC 4470]